MHPLEVPLFSLSRSLTTYLGGEESEINEVLSGRNVTPQSDTKKVSLAFTQDI